MSSPSLGSSSALWGITGWNIGVFGEEQAGKLKWIRGFQEVMQELSRLGYHPWFSLFMIFDYLRILIIYYLIFLFFFTIYGFIYKGDNL